MFIFSRPRGRDIARPYVAGIFTEGDNARLCDYIDTAPRDSEWLLLRLPMTFPFFIAECTGAREPFSFHQTEDDASWTGDIVYTITEAFAPSVPWNDEMGNLPHEHVAEVLEDEQEVPP